MSGHQSEGVVLTVAEQVTRGLYSHINRGGCPDEVEGWDSRDSECTACAMLDWVLRKFSAKTGAAQCPECEGETFSCTACGSVQEHLTTALAAQAGRVAEVVEKVVLPIRRYAESKALTAKALGHEDRPWLDLLINLEPERIAARVAAELEADQ